MSLSLSRIAGGARAEREEKERISLLPQVTFAPSMSVPLSAQQPLFRANIEVDGDANFLSECKGVKSWESAEFILLRKAGSIKVYSLDGELQRTFKEIEWMTWLIVFNLSIL